MIRKVKYADIDGIVAVHLSSFQGFFLTFLGNRFLKLLYSELIYEPGNVSFVSINSSDKVEGFIVGVCDQSGLYKRLAKKKWFSFALVSVSRAIVHPSIIPRLIRALTYSSNASKSACPALLMSLAVSPHAMGKGIGKQLVVKFLDELERNGITKVCLTTDRDHNPVTNNFYKRLGFLISREYQTAEGRWMYEYVKEI